MATLCCGDTYNMIAFGDKRSKEAENIIEDIRNQERGILLRDDVHVVPAHMFRKVISLTKSQCKLGLTATLVWRRKSYRFELPYWAKVV